MRPAAPDGKAPVKKKKIIIVTGNAKTPRQGGQRGAYSTGGGGSYQGAQGRRPGRPGDSASQQGQGGQRRREGGRSERPQSAQQPVHRIIKPSVRPTQMEVDYHKPVQQPVRRPRPEAEQPVQEVQTAAAAPAPAEVMNEPAEAVVKAAPEVQKEAAAPVRESAAVQKPAEVPAEAPKAAETVRPAEAAAPAAPAAPAAAPAAQPVAEQKPETAPAQAQEQRTETRAEQSSVQRAEQPAGQPQRQERYERTDRADRGDRSSQPRSGGARPYDRQDRQDRQDRGAARGPRTGFGEGRPQGGQRYGDRPAGGYRSGQGGPQRDGRPSAGPGGRGTGAPRTGGFRSGQGSSPFGGSQGRSQGGRPFSAQPGRGPVSGEGKSRRPGGDGFSSEKKRDDKNRKNNQRRDERSRKDRIYTDEQEAVRKNRPGRFIKPEKRPEETVEEQIKMITIPEKITLRDLAEKMHISPAEIIKKLFLKGQVMTPNSELDYEQASNIAEDYDILCEEEEKVDVIEELLKEEDDSEDDMVPRPPVICVMGHVDHGKTSLLDAIRKTNVTDKEAGGITQAIGAYTVSIDGRSITFLDTPGHEAFTAMRMRGANSTDIAVLVVAADDGVMPQTKEAISHAKAAGVEIVVAINKIDKPGANVDRVKQELTEYDLIPTDWGGSTEFAEVSAKTGEGIEDLLETILLTADVMELKANPNRLARGLVLEAKLDKGRGPVANVLVQKGTLHVGDFISAGACSGKVRAMIDDKGRRVKEAKPSQPVEILGLSDVPSAGEVLVAHESNESSKAFAATYKTQHKEELLEETRMRMNLDDLFSQMKEGNLKEFNLIIKADVQGSVEALKASLLKLSNEEVVVKVIHSGVGAITESDVTLASASNAVIIGFGVRPDATAKALADHEGVDVRLYKVIYQAIDAVEAALKGMLAPVYEERVIGHVEVRMLFKASHVGNIAGSYVTDGVIRRGCLCRIRRGDEMIYEGKLASLKRFKDDAKEVKEGFECGLVFDGFDKMQVGDIVEAYDLVEVPRT